MKKITLIGLDLAKNIFRINCLDERGKRVLNKNLHRDNLIPFLSGLPPCIVAMEACASSHYWGRRIEELGHTAKLLNPRYVTPYRLGDKNDANDSAAICAAAQRPDMRFVRLKNQSQSDIQSLHKTRNGMIKERTAVINRIRAILADNGIVMKQGPTEVFALLPMILDDTANGLSGCIRQVLHNQYRHLLHLRDQTAELDKMLKERSIEDDDCSRLLKIPGLGVVTATLLASEIGNGASFSNSRSFAAYLGLVPKQFSSGGKNKLLGISKRGHAELRTLLVHGARSICRVIVHCGMKPFGGSVESWFLSLMERRGKNRAIVALAGKLARIAWKILTGKEHFQRYQPISPV